MGGGGKRLLKSHRSRELRCLATTTTTSGRHQSNVDSKTRVKYIIAHYYNLV